MYRGRADARAYQHESLAGWSRLSRRSRKAPKEKRESQTQKGKTCAGGPRCSLQVSEKGAKPQRPFSPTQKTGKKLQLSSRGEEGKSPPTQVVQADDTLATGRGCRATSTPPKRGTPIPRTNRLAVPRNLPPLQQRKQISIHRRSKQGHANLQKFRKIPRSFVIFYRT